MTNKINFDMDGALQALRVTASPVFTVNRTSENYG